MKNIPGNLPLKAYDAITSKKLGQLRTSYRTCLIGGDGCAKAIRSHSVPVAVLNHIAIEGHVYTFPAPTHEEMQSIYSGGPYLPKPLSINDASTYHGFCSSHDDSIFSEIEKIDIRPTNRQVFLFHFRAYSRALYQNINGKKILQELCKAQLPDDHNPIDALAKIASMLQPQEDVFLNLTTNFEGLKLNMESGTIPKLGHIFIRLDCIPDVMCCTLFVPPYDIEGRFLLPLAMGDELESDQHISINISKDSVGGFILLVWGGEDSIVSAFIRTFMSSGYDLNRLIAVIFGVTDNYFLNEHWWKKIDDERRGMLMYFASMQFLNLADDKRDHLKQMHSILHKHQRTYVNWPILSVDYVKHA